MRIAAIVLATVAPLAAIAAPAVAMGAGTGHHHGTVAVPYAAKRDAHLRRCEDAIVAAIMKGDSLTSGTGTRRVDRQCRHLTARETSRAETWTIRMQRVFGVK